MSGSCCESLPAARRNRDVRRTSNKMSGKSNVEVLVKEFLSDDQVRETVHCAFVLWEYSQRIFGSFYFQCIVKAPKDSLGVLPKNEGTVMSLRVLDDPIRF